MGFPNLNLPLVEFKTKLVRGDMQVFDPVRKKYFLLTSEEWVRQHFISYLNKYKNYPLGLMRVEQMIKYNKLRTRADIVLYNNEGIPTMIIECKSPTVKISQDTFYQIARYNSKLRVKYLVLTNGLQHFCCEINYDNNDVLFLDNIPAY